MTYQNSSYITNKMDVGGFKLNLHRWWTLRTAERMKVTWKVSWFSRKVSDIFDVKFLCYWFRSTLNVFQKGFCDVVYVRNRSSKPWSNKERRQLLPLFFPFIASRNERVHSKQRVELSIVQSINHLRKFRSFQAYLWIACKIIFVEGFELCHQKFFHQLQVPDEKSWLSDFEETNISSGRVRTWNEILSCNLQILVPLTHS